MEQRLVIPGVLPDFNKVIEVTKRHWSNYSKEKKKWTDDIIVVVKKQKPITFHQPVFTTYIWTPKDLRKDPDNICFAKKYILDALVKAGVIKDDRRPYIKGFADLFAPPSREAPRVEVILTTFIPGQEQFEQWDSNLKR